MFSARYFKKCHEKNLKKFKGLKTHNSSRKPEMTSDWGKMEQWKLKCSCNLLGNWSYRQTRWKVGGTPASRSGLKRVDQNKDVALFL